jgi:hypothetical protein
MELGGVEIIFMEGGTIRLDIVGNSDGLLA